MPAWEDLDDFLDEDDFAVRATLTLLDGEVREVVGIFDNPYVGAQLGEYEQDTCEPRFTCKESDVSDVERGCRLIVGFKTYDVLSAPEADGTGLATLILAPT